MKIGIIAATGKSGQFLTKEALEQGYQVVALVRDIKKMNNIKNKNLIVRQADLNDQTSIINNTKDIEILISAYGPTGADHSLHEKFAHTLINVMHANKNISRLLVVGGAGSLLNDQEELVFESDLFPKEWQEHARMQWKALETYRNSDINWTYFSPALWYLPEGKKNNQFIYGKNHILFNANKESKISYASVAAIIINEIKNKQYIKTRFHAIEK